MQNKHKYTDRDTVKMQFSFDLLIFALIYTAPLDIIYSLYESNFIINFENLKSNISRESILNVIYRAPRCGTTVKSANYTKISMYDKVKLYTLIYSYQWKKNVQNLLQTS
jgi:hypothetical protein